VNFDTLPFTSFQLTNFSDEMNALKKVWVEKGKKEKKKEKSGIENE
jgi:P pilus assembly chaperone PapD